MRQEYIDFIKKYINSKPDYKERLEEVKSDVITYGATEDEFYLALEQIENNIPSKQQSDKAHFKKFGEFRNPFHQKKSDFTKYLLELDIASHAIVGIILVCIVAIYFISPGILLDIVKIVKAPAVSPATTVATAQRTFAPQVYASKEELNGSDIFKYKPSDITLVATGIPKKEVYGFFPYWMLENQENITLSALTTIALFGLEVDGRGNIITVRENGADPGWEMWKNPRVDTLIQRARSQNVKVELTIKAFSNDNIESLVLSDTAQKTFIANTLNLLQSKPIQGINLDFEYVGNPSPTIKDGMTRLITNLRSELKRQIPDSTLTLDTYVVEAASPRLIDIPKIAPHLDAFVVMGYDVHTPSGSPGPIAPMEGGLGLVGLIQSYLEKVSPDKIILAFPYYGYDWPVPQVGEERGKTLPYAQIVEVSKAHQIQWDENAQSPFYQYVDEGGTSRIVHFENTRSLGIKYDYVKRKDLRGVGIWALGYDGLNSDLRSLIVEKFAN